MAPSDKFLLILLLAAIAVVAPYVPPAEASAAEPKTAAPSPADGVVLHPEAEYSIPDMPVPALLPCPPLFPKIPLIPCHNVPAAAAEVTECDRRWRS
jgi:hypothetical protein